VTVHASLSGRDTRGGGAFHTRMAITAIDAVVAHMVLVAELDGLLARDVLVGQIRSAGQAHHTPESQGCEQRPKKDTEPRDKIRTAVKNLSHVKFALLW